ncbi:MAG: hypothetical protein K2X48_03975 [Chitinophagaceae bacterium]|nr:hypothetical protein [Chitinophagaceae bacterium]
MKDTRSILLLLVSLCLIGTWVFHIYDKSKYAALQPSVPAADTLQAKKKLNDSIQQLYMSTVIQLEGTKLGNDSLNRELQQKISEIDTLRFEIAKILNVNNLTKEDLRRALDKIQNLQQKINQLYQPSSTPSNTIAAGSNNLPVPVAETKKTQTLPTAADILLQANDVNIRAVKKADDNTEDADHFTVSFQVKNNSSASGTASVYVVLKGPDGNTVQDDQWIAGVFQSKNEGMVKYSRRLTADFGKGETRQMRTTVPVNRFNGGGYQLQIYQNGQRIAKADLVLN